MPDPTLSRNKALPERLQRFLRPLTEAERAARQQDAERAEAGRAAALEAERTERAEAERVRAERVRAEAERAATLEAERVQQAPSAVAGHYAHLPVRARRTWLPPSQVPMWAPSTSYAVDAHVQLAGVDYLCRRAGTSGTAGPRPAPSPDVELTDGSVVWRRLGALRVARQWAAQLLQGLEDRATPMLVLMGDVGTGKTSAVIQAVLDGALERYLASPRVYEPDYPSVVLWAVTEVAISPQYGAAAEQRMAAARGAEVLVLDDLGEEPTAKEERLDTPWLASLQALLNYRYSNNLLTAITTNAKSTDVLLTRYGPRVMDRVREAAKVVHAGDVTLRQPPQP